MLKHDLFFIGSGDQKIDQIIEIKNKIEANHISSVLRKRPGDIIILSDGKDFYYEVEILQSEKKFIQTKIKHTFKISHEKNEIKLHISLLKGSTFDLQIEKAIEIGVSSIQPIITDHVIAKKSKVDKWKDVIKTALKQSKQPRMVGIFEPVKLTSLKRSENDIWVVPEIVDEQVSFDQLNTNSKNVNLFIGPEGGFSQRELSHFKEQGASFHSLGSNRLRAETATWVSLTLLKNRLQHY